MWWYLWKRLRDCCTHVHKNQKFIFVTNLKQACADASKIGKIVYCTYKYFVQQNVSDGSKTLLYHFFITQIFIVFWVNYTCLAILVSNQRWQ